MASAAPAQTRCGVTVCIDSGTGFTFGMIGFSFRNSSWLTSDSEPGFRTVWTGSEPPASRVDRLWTPNSRLAEPEIDNRPFRLPRTVLAGKPERVEGALIFRDR